MSHSKRNTSRAVFTSHERVLAKANWSSNSARLTRDSFLPFGSCSLCLEIARDPVACFQGDIFCRECALANILAQKKELKRAEKVRRQAFEEETRAKLAKDSENQQRAIREFELTQAGLRSSAKTANSHYTISEAKEVLQTGAKRKLILDDEELARRAEDDRKKARKAIDEEKAAKPTLPSFWTPSLTPDVRDSNIQPTSQEIKTVPTCPASSEDSLHAISMQRLVNIKFQEDSDNSKDGNRRSCPSCHKTLTNSSSPVMAQQCGHVMCLGCVKRFLIPSKSKAVPESHDSEPSVTCYVCDAPISGKSSTQGPLAISLPVGLVLLKSEGTGFSARGSNTVQKSDVSFQC